MKLTCGNCHGTVIRKAKGGFAFYLCRRCHKTREVPLAQEVAPRAEAMLFKAHEGIEEAAPTTSKRRPSLDGLMVGA